MTYFERRPMSIGGLSVGFFVRHIEMQSARQQDEKLLLATSYEIVRRLRGCVQGTGLRIRQPRKAHDSGTDGWLTVIGNLGKKSPRISIWFDRYTRYPQRKLWAGFQNNDAKSIDVLARLSEQLWPVRELTELDTEDSGRVLKQRLGKNEFNAPVLEHYAPWKSCFFGFYDPTPQKQGTVNTQFCDRAVAFLLDVARSVSPPPLPEQQHEVYPCCENRKWVVAHLSRERSKLLATECKIRDDYECKVCGMKFSEVYGEEIGGGFAEAHHITPLGELPDKVTTELKDLVTVCANCHRMLHRMDGKRGDIAKLRSLVRKRLSAK